MKAFLYLLLITGLAVQAQQRPQRPPQARAQKTPATGRTALDTGYRVSLAELDALVGSKPRVKGPGYRKTTGRMAPFGNLPVYLTKIADSVYTGRVLSLKDSVYLELERTDSGYYFRPRSTHNLVEHLGLAEGSSPEARPSAAVTLQQLVRPLDRMAELAQAATAQVVLWLDLDGDYLVGTPWSSSPQVLAPTSLTLANQQLALDMTREDYRPFNVLVTIDSVVYYSFPPGRRHQVIVTPSNEWYGTGAGGVSFTGSMEWGDDTPSFVFDDLQAQNLVVEVPSHELAHGLGLRHQATWNASCVFVNGYHTGSGNSVYGASPIMGNPYGKALTTWVYGQTAFGCTPQYAQDDLALIAQTIRLLPNGEKFRIGYRWDESSDHPFSARVLENGKTIRADIARPYETDWYVFSVSAPATVTLSAYPLGAQGTSTRGNLDLQFTLYTERLDSLDKGGSTTVLQAVLTKSLPAGLYYVKLEGEKNNPNRPGGYGFAGRYSLSLTYTP